MYKWNGSSYQSYHQVSCPGSLSTFDGFWVRVKAGASLLIPPVAAKAALAGNEPATEGWWIQLIATAGSYTDPGNRLGRLKVATDFHDEYDLEELTPYAAPFLTLVFPHPDWSSDAWSYTTDLRQERAGAGGLWSFELRSDTAREVTLQWQGEGGQYEALPGRSLLTDVESGTTIDPAAQPSYTFAMAGGAHRFSWFVNSLPTLDVGADRRVTVGKQLLIAVPFADEDAEDSQTATIWWGEGPSEPALVDPVTSTVSAAHRYTASGTYTGVLCVEDSFPSRSCANLRVEVLGLDIFSDSFEPGNTSRWQEEAPGPV